MRAIILGIDSSDVFLSVGLASSSGLILSRSSEPGSHNKNMLHQFISDVMGEAKVGMDDIAAVSIALGPGSFTGLRVGLAVAKGICWSLELPMAGISSLLAIAHCANRDWKRIVTVKDAKREEFYFAAFERADGGFSQTVPDSVGAAEGVLKIISDGYRSIGPGVEALGRYSETMQFDEGYDRQALGGAVALLGQQKLASGEILDIASAAPTYVRIPRPREWKS